ncbi:SUKH-4 family immunity protein [Streptomyces sp. YGL11-2]|uniref:SUKH-4 family immunity protein n=1 Tax=Streptomyces sp. YGL11-2 TaxID=3414028 RepID=UPI003CF3BFA8
MTTPASGHRGGSPVRRWSSARLDDLAVPSPLRELLASPGLPESVGPYFRAARDPLPLARYATEAGLPQPVGEVREFWHLGDDGGTQICCAPDGEVVSASCAGTYPTRLVNTTARTWLASLAELGRLLQDLTPDPVGPDAVTAVAKCQERLTALDPEAMADEEHWWPLVIDDLRLTASVDSSGILEFRTATGATRTVSGHTLPGQGHALRRLGGELLKRDIAARQVTRAHADLAPCALPGCYCAAWLATTFPGAEVSYSFDYGPGAADREAGIQELTAFIEEADEGENETEGSEE